MNTIIFKLIRKYTKIFLLLTLCFSNCIDKEGGKKIQPIDSKTNDKKNIETKIPPKFSHKDYARLFKYSAEQDNQLLGITFFDKETIKFYLITETLPCDTEYWGIAENKKLKNISKIDFKKEDEYFVDVYSKIVFQ
tara:strand:+ start:3608 stop:4015 length:408 start_codon:yes stop_codon:yes gene_type:complete